MAGEFEFGADAGPLGMLAGMIDEAVILFDEDHKVVAANRAAAERFGFPLPTGGLIRFDGPDVKDLFYTTEFERCTGDELPFALDGSLSNMVAFTRDGSLVPMLAKCERLAYEGLHLLVSYTDLRGEGQSEYLRLYEELTHLNERLHGTLSIISSASMDGVSFEEQSVRVANELQRVMSADAAILYLADDYGFTPYGASDGFATLGIEVEYLPMGVGAPTLVTRNRRTTRLQLVSPPTTPDSGAIMLDLDIETRFRMRSAMAECCSTLVGTPVFSYDRIVAVVMVGWVAPHLVNRDDVELLDTVAEYLSVEFATAAIQMEQARSGAFSSAMGEIREAIRSERELSDSLISFIAERVRGVVPSHTFTMEANACTNTNVVYMDDPLRPGETQAFEFPYGVADIFFDESECVAVEPSSPCGMWIGRRTDLVRGFAILLNRGDSPGRPSQDVLFVMRGGKDRPFDAIEQSFLRNLAGEVGDTLHVEHERAHDAEISQALQVGLKNELPAAKGVTTASLYISATESAVVGGDFFDLYELPDSRVVVVTGDVSGKGVEAAAMASLVKTALAAYAWNFLDPASMLASLNNLFLNFSRLETFASMVVVSLDFRNGEATYCSAGHPPAMVVHRPEDAAAELELLTVQSPIVGAFEGMRYENGMFTFAPGDILYMYTDGTTEARSEDGEFFGENALRDTLLRVARGGVEGIPRGVLAEVEKFAGGSLHDDIAMVAVRFDGICPADGGVPAGEGDRPDLLGAAAVAYGDDLDEVLDGIAFSAL